MKAIVWEILTPDEANETIGWRWTLQYKGFFVTKEYMYNSERSCENSLIKFARTYFDYPKRALDIKYKSRTNTEFLA